MVCDAHLDPEKPSQDVVAGGMIERIPFDEACALDMPCSRTACEHEAIYRNAEAGLWYDAIGCLLDLLERKGNTDSLREMLDDLLRQSGVHLPILSIRYLNRYAPESFWIHPSCRVSSRYISAPLKINGFCASVSYYADQPSGTPVADSTRQQQSASR